MTRGQLVNAMTVDVEDYFHVTAFAGSLDRARWSIAGVARRAQHACVCSSCSTRHGVRTTFFVLGWVAERVPGLIQELHRAGHEIACHGLTHELVYKQTPQMFRAGDSALEGAARGSDRSEGAWLSRRDLFDHAAVAVGARHSRGARLRVRLERLSGPARSVRHSGSVASAVPRGVGSPARSAADDGPRVRAASAVRGRRLLPAAAVRRVPLGIAPRERRRPAGGVLHASLGNRSRAAAHRGAVALALPALHESAPHSRSPRSAVDRFPLGDHGGSLPDAGVGAGSTAR